ncbi:hypothetical protein V6M85_12045 [Sulfolobus tengchongensis]|uniref:Uncharacterized protein n=1 Tax=Sulfolobus tengchongensis TaxID=207809 RepID=A0AAX4KZQ2_9CREN
MTLNAVIERYLLSEESIIKIREGEIKAEDFLLNDNEISVGIRVIIVGRNGRRRLTDLGLLQIIAKCGYLEFVKDYLDMSLTLKDIYKKYNIYTELEFIAYHYEECNKYVKDEDVKYTLLKVKDKILNRKGK